MTYPPSLTSLLTSRTYLPSGSCAEIAIRAASILAVEAVRDEIARLRQTGAGLNAIAGHDEVPSVLIDFFLWDLGMFDNLINMGVRF